LDRLKARIRESAYPGKEFVDLVGILIGSLLLLTPGFVTDVVGYLLLLPFLRDRLAKVIARKLDSHFREVYEYLKLSGV
ncbi:MAG TPA: FxsA family protein, partial [Spirochaetia bacterium]|nr:FxsA family protein [Spirochaetia bacterium]